MRTRWVRFSIRELIGVTAFVGVVLAVGMYGTDNEDQEYFVQALAPCLVGIVLVVVLGIAVGSPRKRRNILLAFVGGALAFNTIGMMSIFQFATLPGANWEGTLLDAQLLWALTYGTVLAVGYLCAKITQAVQGYEEQDQGSS